ncbi:MAG: hypothetical protein PHE43_04110 [Candidatus Nanoarchaeia archaeon]|nr:hypothetical protein [Candidatus Nanoarchaeia archaeon]
MNDEDKIRKFESAFKIEDINIDNDRLMVYVIDILEGMKIEPTFDKTVVAAFKMFPSRFSLVGFKEYPDAKRVHDCLFHCTYKTKGWIIGNAQSGYKVSDKGKYYLEEIQKIIDKEIELPKTYQEKVRRKERTAIDSFKETKAFKKYFDGGKKDIDKDDVKEALNIFKYADKKDIEKNLYKYLSYAEILDDRLALDFLNFISKNKERLI